LEVESVRRESTFTSGTTAEMIKRLIAAEHEDVKEPKSDPRRLRDKGYFIRENKVLSSAAKIH
jgi:hypothetical protein